MLSEKYDSIGDRTLTICKSTIRPVSQKTMVQLNDEYKQSKVKFSHCAMLLRLAYRPNFRQSIQRSENSWFMLATSSPSMRQDEMGESCFTGRGGITCIETFFSSEHVSLSNPLTMNNKKAPSQDGKRALLLV